MLCLGGAVLFAIVTVLQELSVKNTDIVEYLGLLGLFGSILSGVQMLVLSTNYITHYDYILLQGDFRKTNINYVYMAKLKCTTFVIFRVSIHVLHFFLGVFNKYGNNSLTLILTFREFLYTNCRNSTF